MNTDILEHAGLTKNEIKIYLALLEKGESTAGPLIREVGINSSKVYESLERLQRKGLASFVKKTNKRHFQPADPARLLDYIDEKKRQLENEREEVAQLLPMLETHRKQMTDEAQGVAIYQGVKGYRTLLENMLDELSPKGSYCAFASGMLKEVLGPYWFVYQKKKRKYGIKASCIWDPRIRKQKDYLEEYYGGGRFISRGAYLSPVDVFVYNDKVIQVSYSSKPIFAVLIRSKGLADSYRDLFRTIWRIGEKK